MLETPNPDFISDAVPADTPATGSERLVAVRSLGIVARTAIIAGNMRATDSPPQGDAWPEDTLLLAENGLNRLSVHSADVVCEVGWRAIHQTLHRWTENYEPWPIRYGISVYNSSHDQHVAYLDLLAAQLELDDNAKGELETIRNMPVPS